MKHQIIASALVAGIFSSCCHQGMRQETKTDILGSNIDSTVKPTEDFFDYANGGWMKRTSIPSDEARWGIGNMVQKELYEKLRHINEEAEKKGDKTGTSQQIGDFWFSAMDTASIEKNGIAPLNDELGKIAAMKTLKDVLAQAAHMHGYGCNVFFDEGVSQDLKASDVEAYYLSQGGLGMPIRNYYFDNDARTVKVREAYPKYISSLFQLIGVDSVSAKKKADGIA